MIKLMRSSLYKLFRDKTFHIILIIGVVVSVFMPLLYLIIDSQTGNVGSTCNGYNLILQSASPVQNFGIAIPINLITFIIGEFNYGTIRNKIIAGNKKSSIYLSLFINGLIFSFILLFAYMLISSLLATAFGGFSSEPLNKEQINALLLFLINVVLVYVTLTALSVLTASTFRHIGGSISGTVVLMTFSFVVSIIVFLSSENTPTGLLIFNPLALSSFVSLGLMPLEQIMKIENIMLYQVLSNLFYTSIFLVLGTYLFQKRDVK